MTRTLALALVLAAALLLPAALAAPSQDAPSAQDKAAAVVPGSAPSPSPKARVKKPAGRAVKRAPPGYGFLPGYEPPPPTDRYGTPLYGPRFDGGGPRYWYRGRYYYGWGGPRFYRGQWNAGSFGPCWTQTPIGPMWNCGR